MLKKIAAVVLIVLAGGTWGYLDYLNKQEIKASEELRKSMEQARAQAKARAESKAKFESLIIADLSTCKAAAEQAKADFITKNQQPVRRKPGQFTIPQGVADEAAKELETANTACQAAYTARLANGS
jgi:hypothetical protein